VRLLFCGFIAFASSIIPFYFEPRPAVFIFLVVFGTTWYISKPDQTDNKPISRRYHGTGTNRNGPFNRY
jgi:hypothetical protein